MHINNYIYTSVHERILIGWLCVCGVYVYTCTYNSVYTPHTKYTILYVYICSQHTHTHNQLISTLSYTFIFEWMEIFSFSSCVFQNVHLFLNLLFNVVLIIHSSKYFPNERCWGVGTNSVTKWFFFCLDSLLGHLTLSADDCHDPYLSERKQKRGICSLNFKCCHSSRTYRKHYLHQRESLVGKRMPFSWGAPYLSVVQEYVQKNILPEGLCQSTTFLNSAVVNNFPRVYKGSFLLVLNERCLRLKAKGQFSESSSTEERIK